MENEQNELAGLTDTHAHITDWKEPSPKGIPGIDAGARLRELADAGFAAIMDVGTEAGDLSARLAAWQSYDRSASGGFTLRFSAGIWPLKEAIAERAAQVATLEKCIKDAAAAGTRIAAIGECGFDRRENPEPSSGEAELFEMQLELAQRMKLPIIVHSREAFEETFNSVKKYPGVIGIIHCFSYSVKEVKPFLDAGYYISFAGNLTFKNAPLLREAITAVPDDRLLLETDSPYLAPVPHRGAPCESGMVIETYRCAAACRHSTVDALKLLVRENTRALLHF
jgi:TatD DNase family protein